MEITGVITELLKLQTGENKQGKAWAKQDFILETEGQYPKKVCISAFGSLSDDANICEGNVVKVSINIESREYNTKWYTNVNAWKITGTRGAGPVTPKQEDPNKAQSPVESSPAMKKLEEEDQFASMGSSEIEAPSENLGTQGDQKTSEEVSPGAVPQTGGVETPEAEIPLKTYIEQYKSQYSKEALKSALLNNGYDSTLVDTCLEKYF